MAPSTASVTERRWIRWVPDAPFEDTSTLVLSAPTGHFVDIRLRLEETRHYDDATSAGEHSFRHEQESRRPSSRSLSEIDWAFAGLSNRSFEEPGGFLRGRWEHWVDSRTANKQVHGVVDEGILLDFSGGANENDWAHGLELEKGKMINPTTGNLQDYEELWADLPVAGKEGLAGLGNESSACVVLKTATEMEKCDVRGLCIRVGSWIQSVIRKEDKVLASRYIIEPAGVKEGKPDVMIRCLLNMRSWRPAVLSGEERTKEQEEEEGKGEEELQCPLQIAAMSTEKLTLGPNTVRVGSITWCVEYAGSA